MLQNNYNHRQEEMRNLLATMATELGSESGFVQRKSKMSSACFCQTMVLGSLEEGEKSLSGFAQVSQDLGVEISASGLNQRLNDRAVELLEKLLAKSIDLNLKPWEQDEILARFGEVHLVDSSYLALPKVLQAMYPGIGRGTAAGLKLYLNYNYRAGQIQALEIRAGRSTDQTSRIHIDQAQPGSLSLFDLGFFKQELFAEFTEKKAYFVSRYQNQTALYTETGARFDLFNYLRTSQEAQIDLSLHLGSKVKTRLRLLALRLPESVAAERKRKAKEKAKKDGRRPTPPRERLDLLDWVLLITNVPAELLSVEQIAVVYRLRWQIELIFKLWKSRAKLKQIGPYRRQRVLCQFYARLIALVLFHFLIAPTYAVHKELSLPKAFDLVKRQVSRLIDAIAGHGPQLAHVLQKIDAGLLRYGRMDKRKKNLSTYQLLLAAGL